MALLPDQGNVVLCDIFIGVDECHPLGNSGMRIKQITAHLHIILEIIKGCVKIICHPYLPFQAAEFALFLLPLIRRLVSKGKNNRPRWYFGGTSIVSRWLTGISTICVTLMRKK
jgi:hypothetical protein